MGLTPLGGFMMGTRSGSLDPSVITFIAEKEHLTPEEMSKILNKESGLLGISRFCLTTVMFVQPRQTAI